MSLHPNPPDSDAPKFRRRRCKLESCRVLFRPKKKWQLFCTNKHRQKYHFTLPEVRKLDRQIRNVVKEELERLIPDIAKKLRLLFEVEPPPGMISRIADEVKRKENP